MSESLRMMRETVAQALNPLLYEIAMGKRDDTPGGALSYEAADLALTALGLDDLDAAVERAAEAWFDGEYVAFAWDDPPASDDLFRRWQGCRSKARIHALAILEAALLATQEGENG